MKISAILELWMDFSFQPLDRMQKVVTDPPNVYSPMPAGSWIISSDEVDKQGQPAFQEYMSVCSALLDHGATDRTPYDRCVTDHGFQAKTVYQPADRYWLFQGIESAIYLLFATILVAMTFWWTKYRIIGK